jgi:hypothetical protein
MIPRPAGTSTFARLLQRDCNLYHTWCTLISSARVPQLRSRLPLVFRSLLSDISAQRSPMHPKYVCNFLKGAATEVSCDDHCSPVVEGPNWLSISVRQSQERLCRLKVAPFDFQTTPEVLERHQPCLPNISLIHENAFWRSTSTRFPFHSCPVRYIPGTAKPRIRISRLQLERPLSPHHWNI